MTILSSAFSGKEASKIVISRCSLESEALHSFQVIFFSNMIVIVNFKVIPIKFMKYFLVRTTKT